LLETLFVVSCSVIAMAVAVPQVLAALDDFRAFGAARYVCSRLQLTRMEAVTRTANTAIRFTQSGSSYAYAVYSDGNDNGVLSREIQRGIDPEIRQAESLPLLFQGVDFGAIPGLPAVDDSSTPPGSDPIRIGNSNMVAFTAQGTSTPGSLYIRGRRQTQYVIRVFGDTGKTRILKFDLRTRAWRQL
jgi:hypothetical protein